MVGDDEFEDEGSLEDEVEVERERMRRGPAASLDDWVFKLLKEARATAAPPDSGEDRPTRVGRVLAVGMGRCRVQFDAGEVECGLRPELAAGQQTDLAVGDEVRFSGEDEQDARVEDVLPRRTTLSRPDPFHHHIERVVAANIDAVVIVVSVGTPPLHPRLIDRYLIAVQRGGAAPLIAVNKMDLLTTAEERAAELEKLDPYRELGVPVLTCSTTTGEGSEPLLAALTDRLCVFVGHSGVGKSSLVNALRPELNLETNTVRAADGKGRHTTTHSHLYDLGRGIRVIDTPGIREFGLWKMTAAEVRWYFEEFQELGAACKFADCSHTHEPDCAVKRAVHGGRLSASRYQSYQRIVATL